MIRCVFQIVVKSLHELLSIPRVLAGVNIIFEGLNVKAVRNR